MCLLLGMLITYKLVFFPHKMLVCLQNGTDLKMFTVIRDSVFFNLTGFYCLCLNYLSESVFGKNYVNHPRMSLLNALLAWLVEHYACHVPLKFQLFFL